MSGERFQFFPNSALMVTLSAATLGARSKAYMPFFFFTTILWSPG
jgi:hypothetical protein